MRIKKFMLITLCTLLICMVLPLLSIADSIEDGSKENPYVLTYNKHDLAYWGDDVTDFDGRSEIWFKAEIVKDSRFGFAANEPIKSKVIKSVELYKDSTTNLVANFEEEYYEDNEDNYFRAEYDVKKGEVYYIKVSIGQSTESDDYVGCFMYSITPAETKITKITSGKKYLIVKWKAQKDSADGYEIRYSRNSKMNNAKIIKVAGKSKVSKKITKLKSKTKYYVQVRTYCNYGDEIYESAWSKISKAKTLK